MKEMINKKILILISLLLSLLLFVGCFGTPPINNAPTIISTPIATATVDVLYNYDVDATDPDGSDTLTYALTTNPVAMTIDSATGVISWTPSTKGDYDVAVEVSDGELLDTQSFEITVDDPCSPCDDPCDPCDPCSPCYDPCDPCDDPCDPCDPCSPCYDPCDPCDDPCDPCDPSSPCYDPCDPCA